MTTIASAGKPDSSVTVYPEKTSLVSSAPQYRKFWSL